MRKVIFTTVSIACLAAVGQMMPPSPQEALASRPQVDLNKNPRFVKATGGLITIKKPGSSFLFADACGIKDEEVLSDVLATITKTSRIPAECKPFEYKGGCAFKAAKEALASGKYGAVAFAYAGKEDEPVLVDFPEDRVCLLNVTPFKKGVDAGKYSKRLESELWRAFCYAAGGANSGLSACVMRPIFKPEDLDVLECRMASPGALQGVVNSAKKYGFGSSQQTTYVSACRAGTAPEPTTPEQKAVWDRVAKEKAEAMKEPTKPMKIKFDPKKGR